MSKDTSIELTILMPCLNEAETIAHCIQKAKSFLAKHQVQGEILISDNGSQDGSQELAVHYGARVIHVAERGYGAALIAGIKDARGQYVIMGDADGSYDFENLLPFLEHLRQGYDLVMGNRFKGGIKPGAMPFLNKYLGNPVLSFLGRLFFRCPVRDFHCGLRGMNRYSMEKIDLQTPGMEFASEMVVKASLKNLKMTEVPTVLSPDGRSRPPHLRKWRDGWRHLRFLLLSSPRWMFFYPGVFLATVGFILMTTLALSPLKIGAYALDIHTLLFASGFFVLGLQSIFFSFFSKIIASIQLKIPLDARLAKFLQFFTLERGIILGLLLVGLGIAGSVGSVLIWAHAQFGSLLPTQVMRITIPAVTCLISGTEIIFASFFMYLLRSSLK